MSNSNPYIGQPNPYGQADNRNSMQANNAINAIAGVSRARTNNFNDNQRNTELVANQNYIPDHNKSSGDLYENSRNSFIKKVYTLLSIQLVITALVCVAAMKTQFFKKAFVNTPSIIIVSVLLMVLSIVVGCGTQVVRKFGLPILIAFTLLFAILVGIICSQTKSEVVLAAAGITAAIVVGLTIFACVTKSDLTGFGPYLFILCLVLVVFGIVCIFWRNPIVQLVYSCLAALLYGVYLVFDTQLVLGKFTNSYSLDDAYFAAIQLYIDIIQIFLQVLRILSYVNN